MQSHDPESLGRALHAVDALRETLVALDDRQAMKRADRLRTELEWRIAQTMPVVPLAVARRRRPTI